MSGELIEFESGGQKKSFAPGVTAGEILKAIYSKIDPEWIAAKLERASCRSEPSSYGGWQDRACFYAIRRRVGDSQT